MAEISAQFSVFASIFICAQQLLITPKSHKFSRSLNSSKCGPVHGTVASHQRSRVREAQFSDYDLMIRHYAGKTGLNCSYRFYSDIRALDTVTNSSLIEQLHKLAVIVSIHHSIPFSSLPFHSFHFPV